MMLLARRQLLAFSPVLLVPALSRAAGEQVLIVSSERGGIYGEAVQALTATLVQGGLPPSAVQWQSLSELDSPLSLKPSLIVAVGSEAAAVMARQSLELPLLCTLLPRQAFQRIAQASGRAVSDLFSAVLVDPRPAHFMELIQLALPRVKRVGVLWSPETKLITEQLKKAAQARNLDLVAVAVAEGQPLFRSLRDVLEESGLLLAMPDPNIYSSNTIQNLLLTAFRANVPVMGYSESFVRAGALLGLYSTPRQLGQQTAQRVLQALRDAGRLAPPQAASGLTVGVNQHVARLFRLDLDEQRLNVELQRTQGRP
ncbi:MAG: hypothetical protein RLZZ596_2000 [Pseudomonadota bacterium]|jgi:ABC-type uncharacterized transport system substrate-binding protein